MDGKLTIGAVARRTGLPGESIRCYEAEGIIPAPARPAAGYRQYPPTDVRRLRRIRASRLLGLSLAGVRVLAERAFASECRDFAAQLQDHLRRQRVATDGRIAELEAPREQLDELARHVLHARERLPAGSRVADRGFCPLIDDPNLETEATR